MSLDWPPQKMPRLAPPCFGKVLSMAAEKGEIPNTLTFSIPMGGQSGTLMFFWNQLLTGQHLANSGGGPVKKITLYVLTVPKKFISLPSAFCKVYPRPSFLKIEPTGFSLHIWQFFAPDLVFWKLSPLDLVYIIDNFYLASLFPDVEQALSKFINCNIHRDY